MSDDLRQAADQRQAKLEYLQNLLNKRMYVMNKTGISLHNHHDRLWGFCYNFDGRVEYIKTKKPVRERKLRLRLFQIVDKSLIPGQDSPEWAAYKQAEVAYDQAVSAWNQVRTPLNQSSLAHEQAWAAYEQDGAAYEQAAVAYEKAVAAYDTVGDAYVLKFSAELAILHAKLCPDCPWDGKTIFSRSDKKGNWY